jgi:ubiquinone/menaquinone biosynthesis C-methylase UbiE
MINKENIALRVNEIFHDLEGKEYQNKHIDIFTGEALRWKKIAKKYFLTHNSPITVLDVGTGTGFIPLNTASILSEKDTFICSDISQEMLDVTKSNLSLENFECKFDFLKLDGKTIDLDKGTTAIITMNSVLHHIPNLELFFTQLNKLLLPNGRIIIGHEPNKLFYQEKNLVNLYTFLRAFSSFSTFIKTIVQLVGLTPFLKKIVKVKPSKITNQINQILLKEALIKEALTSSEINQMIDYHSPTAKYQIDKSKGIDIEYLRNKYLPNFEIEYLETYNFISKMTTRNFLTKKINKSLSEKYQGKGATLFVVFKKNNSN